MRGAAPRRSGNRKTPGSRPIRCAIAVPLVPPGCPPPLTGTLAPIPIRSATTNDDAASSDDALVSRAQAGEQTALETLLRRHYDRIHAVCRRLTGNDADAADAAQNAMIAVARALPRFDLRSRFSTWAYRIAVNCSMDELRRRSRRPLVSLDDVTTSVMGRGDDSDRSVARVDVDAALRQLPAPFRAAVVLRDMCGLDYAEIAEILELPPGTVRSRIARGRAALVHLLERTGSEP